jgi:uncharacterized protein (TIRG00374 family)
MALHQVEEIMRSRIKSQLFFFVKVILAVALITFVLRSGHLKLAALKNLFTPSVILIGLTLVGLNMWMLNWRWYWLLRSRGFQVTTSQTFALYLIGIFFNHALPSSVGGDVVKAYYLARDQHGRKMEAVMSVLLDRVLGLYSLLLLSLLSVVWDYEFVISHPQIRFMAVCCLVLVTGMSISFIIGFSQRIDRAIGLTRFLKSYQKLQMFAKVFESMHLYGRRRSAIFMSVVVSMLAQMLSIGFFVYVGYVLGDQGMSIPGYLFCIPLGFVAMALPIAPAGVGVGQVAFLYLFQAYTNGTSDLGATAITAFQLAILTWGLLGAFFYVRYKKPTGELIA